MHICQACHVGKMLYRKVPYIQWYERNLLIVDRIPALVCDTCGERSYDLQALENLHRLLNSPSSWSREAAFPRLR
jgi:YgiT-type zinc finger domain-containing protein